MSWGYRVMYRQGTKLKDRIFKDFDSARAFADKMKKYNHDYSFERYRYVSMWERLLNFEVTWFNRNITDGIWIGMIAGIFFLVYEIWSN